MLTRAQLAKLRKTPLRGAPNKVALAMELAGVTQEEIAEITGFAQSYVSRVKNGHYSRLPGETMRDLAEYFGCQIEDLFPAPVEAKVPA